MRKESMREVIGFFIPVAIIIVGSLIAIYYQDFDFLRSCTIAGYFFISLFIWRLCVNIYSDALLKSEDNNTTENFEKDDESF